MTDSAAEGANHTSIGLRFAKLLQLKMGTLILGSLLHLQYQKVGPIPMVPVTSLLNSDFRSYGHFQNGNHIFLALGGSLFLLITYKLQKRGWSFANGAFVGQIMTPSALKNCADSNGASHTSIGLRFVELWPL